MKNKTKNQQKAVSKAGVNVHSEDRFKGSSNNPADNTLKSGFSAKDVTEAIYKSGYPLQSIVAGKLRKHFAVQEEWSFVDTEERVVRSIDLFTEIYLSMPTEQQRVRPVLNLIIECKRSDLPYVFFLTEQRIEIPRLPVIAGLAHSGITIHADDFRNACQYDVLRILGLKEHAFLRSDVPFCTTFTRCERKGKSLQLSGSVPYNELVYPLVKALEHFCSIETPPTTALYFDLHFVFGLAVLDAPMVGVLAGESAEPIMLPWVRIARHRGLESARSYDHRRNIYALDVVHIAFLDTYIETHLFPFAVEFTNRALKHHIEIADGQGFIPGMGKKSDDIEAHIVPTQDSKEKDASLRHALEVWKAPKTKTQERK